MTLKKLIPNLIEKKINGRGNIIMKFCSRCGNQLEDEMQFCNKCGEKVEKSSNQYVESNSEKYLKELLRMKERNKNILITIITIVLVIGFIAFIANKTSNDVKFRDDIVKKNSSYNNK